MSLGVRREVLLGRGGPSCVLSLPSEDNWGEAEAVSVASVGCVVERPFRIFAVCKVLGGGRRRAWGS